MEQALVFGAGNIGRGFIGELFTKSGLAVTFADVNARLVEALHAQGAYPLVLVDGDTERVETIRPVDAVLMQDAAGVCAAIQSARLMATAVGVNNLQRIAPVLAQGLAMRMEAGAPPVNILVCENMIGANRLLAEAVSQSLPEALRPALDSQAGFVEVTVGRMVPANTQPGADPLAVRAEPYAKLPYDTGCWRGAPFAIHGGVPTANFAYQIRHKLFIHNLGHAVTGYLGARKGLRYIHEAAEDAAIRAAAREAMAQAGEALALSYPKEGADIQADIDSLLDRFANSALMDPIARVCADPLRKLGPKDRLVGALRHCLSLGVACPGIQVGMAAALLYDAREDEAAQAMRARIAAEGLERFLVAHCGLTEPTVRMPVVTAYGAFLAMA